MASGMLYIPITGPRSSRIIPATIAPKPAPTTRMARAKSLVRRTSPAPMPLPTTTEVALERPMIKTEATCTVMLVMELAVTKSRPIRPITTSTMELPRLQASSLSITGVTFWKKSRRKLWSYRRKAPRL